MFDDQDNFESYIKSCSKFPSLHRLIGKLRADESIAAAIQTYGHDFVSKDFQKAIAQPYCSYKSDLLLGDYFVFSKYAHMIIAYREITRVFVRLGGSDVTDVYYLVCKLRNHQSVDIASDTSNYFDSTISKIQAHIDTPIPLPFQKELPVNQPVSRYSQEELEILRALYQDGSITEEEYRQCFERQAQR